MNNQQFLHPEGYDHFDMIVKIDIRTTEYHKSKHIQEHA